MEQWKDIPNYDNYEISNLANIRNKKTKYLFKSKSSKHRYIQILLSKNNTSTSYALHRLVAEVFVENPENKPQVNHIDGNKRNNIYENLEWVTPSENKIHSVSIGLTSKTNNSNETIEQLDINGNVINTFRGQEDASHKLNCSRHVIMTILKGTDMGKGIGGKKTYPIKINMSENGTLIKTFNSIEEMAKHFKLSKETTSVFLKGKYKRIGLKISKRTQETDISTKNLCCQVCLRNFGNIGGLAKHKKACGKNRPQSIPDTYNFDVIQEIPILRLKDVKKDQEEIWKDIPSFINYQISSLGRLYNKKTKKYSTGANDGRYMRFANASINFREAIHRLVAINFIPNPENKPYVNHKDSNTFNNRVDNLEWVTQSENMIHSLNAGLNHTALKIIQYDINGKEVKMWNSKKQIEKEFNIHHRTISSYLKKKQLVNNEFIFRLENDPLDINDLSEYIKNKT